MPTATLPKPVPAVRRRRELSGAMPWVDVQHYVFEGATWSFYESLLKQVGHGPVRVAYDDGRLEIMSPLPEHERPKLAIGRLVLMLAMELRIPLASYGSTTFRRRDRRKGFEPDECFYVRHERQMRSRRRVNLLRDPPPDLVVEIDITSPSVPREPIYAGLGVPELWRWDGRRLQCLHLVDGKYQVSERSLAFPFLSPADLTRFVPPTRLRGEMETLVLFVGWVRKQGWTWPPTA